MKALKVVVGAIGISLLLALNALAWAAVGEKYLTVKIQQAAVLNLGEQLQEAKVRNAMLEIQIQRFLGRPAGPSVPGCPVFPPKPQPPNDA